MDRHIFLERKDLKNVWRLQSGKQKPSEVSGNRLKWYEKQVCWEGGAWGMSCWEGGREESSCPLPHSFKHSGC